MTTITLPRAVVEQALEALERARPLKADYTTLEYFEEAKRKHYAAMAALRAALAQQAEPVAYTTGHCENHKQKGGCQLHNLQCGWPDCDRKPTTASSQQAEPQQAQRCRAEPRSDGDYLCDCKAGACPGRSAEPAQQAEPTLTIERLRDALVASRIIPPAAVEDPDEYDDGVTLHRIEALHRRIA